jgi:hypothetical protein
VEERSEVVSGLLPQLHLDELLGELQARLQAVVETRDRMHRLLEAVVAVGSGLDLASARFSSLRCPQPQVAAGADRYLIAAKSAPHIRDFLRASARPELLVLAEPRCPRIAVESLRPSSFRC